MDRCDNLCRTFFVLAVFAAAVFLSCAPAANTEQNDINAGDDSFDKAETTGGPPPLVVDTSAPLLLDEPAEGAETSAAAATQAAIDNMDCFVCHANYRSESLASRHAVANVGCSQCHGQSFAHKNDENNTTPPELMYPAGKIDAFCRGCHNAHDVAPGKVVERWAKQGLEKTEPEKIVCTDCHGEHRMEVRTIIWDKNTGKLLRTNRGD